jgi:hypothetical protein
VDLPAATTERWEIPPQSIAMRVTGHETDAMFLRYDITDGRDKLGALEAARRFAEQQPGEKQNLVSVQR